MKKFLVLSLFVFSLTFSLSARAIEEPSILADSAILVESKTGRILYEKNAELELPPASMTKMLTCIIGLETLNPFEEIPITPEAIATADNTLDWSYSDSVSANDLLKAILMVSENGGSVAIAQAVSGSVSEFSKVMNAKARELGCEHTNFVNPNGLPNPNHYSTATDMARIAVYCMNNREFRRIVATEKTSIYWIQPEQKLSELNNTNKLLDDYQGANGIKTGWTRAAGGCLAASAKRGDTELIAVVMHSPDEDTRFDDAKELLDYGFENIKMIHCIDKKQTKKIVFVRGGQQAMLRVEPKENLKFPLFKDESEKSLNVTYELPTTVDAEIFKEEVLGEAVVNYNDKIVARLPLVACERVPKGFSVGSFIVSIVS